MPFAISPIRIAHVTQFSVAINTTVEQEVDFNLGVQEGIQIYQIETVANIGLDATAATRNEEVIISAHAETGTLEDPAPAADGIILNSEVIHHTIYEGFINITDDQPVQLMVQNPKTNFLERMGIPLLMANNITMRYQTGVLMASLGSANIYITYRYVRLTEAELVSQLLLRR